jgi:HSP20 family protein
MLARTLETFDELVRRLDTSLPDLLGQDGMGRARGWRMLPPMEVLWTDSEILVRVELPGVDPDSIDVTLRDGTLRVRAERREPTTEQGEYLRKGFAYGTFEGAVVLPSRIDPDRLSARYEAGVLEVRVPQPAAQAVKIPRDRARRPSGGTNDGLLMQRSRQSR